MIQLKPCPFCGGTPRGWCRSAVHGPTDELAYNGYVSCTQCTAKVRSAHQHPVGPEAIADAARNWNRRVQEA
jgi:Lar family restriction alleviation protein